MNPKDFFIIIVTYNSMGYIDECLKHIYNSNIIVVDNASSDNTVEYIKKKYPKIILLPQKQNMGFGKANNIGLKYAKNKKIKFVLLLNQDAYIDLVTIEYLFTKQKSLNNFGILSPIHLNGKGNLLDKNFSIYLGYDQNKNFYSDYILNKKKKEAYSVPFINAACWFITVECLNKVGGFDPLFFHYGEDNNYCQRVIYHNFKIGVVPHCYVKHDRNIISKGEMDSKSDINNRNLIIEFGNINDKHSIIRLESLIKKEKNKRNLYFLKLKFNKALRVNYKIKELFKFKSDIIISRKKNIEGGYYI